MAGIHRFLAAGGPRKCGAMAKHGGLCRGWALAGHSLPQCLHHSSNEASRERRARLLARPKSPEQAARALRRERARVQRATWRRDRWAAGATVTLGPREPAFESDLRALGFDLAHLSPASADAARWAWLNVQAGRTHPDQWGDRMRWHAARDATGPGA